MAFDPLISRIRVIRGAKAHSCNPFLILTFLLKNYKILLYPKR